MTKLFSQTHPKVVAAAEERMKKRGKVFRKAAERAEVIREQIRSRVERKENEVVGKKNV